MSHIFLYTHIHIYIYSSLIMCVYMDTHLDILDLPLRPPAWITPWSGVLQGEVHCHRDCKKAVESTTP